MLKNIGSNWFLMAVTGVTTYILMPFNLIHLGNEQYGLWLLITALTAYLYLLHLGVPMASVRQLTQAIAANDDARLNQIVSSCVVLYLGLGTVVALLGIPLLHFFEHHYTIAPALHPSVRLAFIFSLIHTGLAFVAFMPFAIMSAYQAFVPQNTLLATAIILRTVLNIVLILKYPNLVMLGVVTLAITTFEMIVAWTYVLRKYPAVRPHLSHFSAAVLREIGAFSVYVFLMALGGQLAFQTSALVVGRFMTAADVPGIAVPNSLMLILMQFLGGIASVIMPMATNLQTNGDIAALRTIFFKWTKIALALSWSAALFLLIFGPAFLAFWIHSAYTVETGRVLRVLMASYLVFLPIRAVTVPLLMGLGKAKGATIATLGAGVLNLVLSIALVGPYGLEGVAWGTAIPNVLLSGVMLYLVCRELGISIKHCLATTFPLATLGGLSAFALLGWWHYIWQPSGLWGLGFAGLLTLATAGTIWAGLVLRNDPHVPLPNWQGLLRWRPAW